MRPLDGVRVLDFSTLLPGPMATFVLAEAGAEVLKLERPGTGEDMRHYPPMVTEDAGVNFALLNRGKRSLAVDLKDQATVAKVLELAKSADVVVEQFRPGVMDRLGLGYEAMKAANPAIVYCAITGYGQDGPKAQVAAHDLNYVADAGMLALAADRDGAPVVPSALVADIGGGAMPAVISILLALRVAERTGEGAKLDIAMTDNLLAWEYWALGEVDAGLGAPEPGRGLVVGGSPRYQVYRTKDGRYLACAPLEQKFWLTFTRLIGLDASLVDDGPNPDATWAAVAEILSGRTAEEWMAVFDGHDVCVNIVRSVAEAKSDAHLNARGLFRGMLEAGETKLTPLPPPFAPALRRNPEEPVGFPALGDANDLLETQS